MSEDEVLAPNWRAAKAADGKEYYFNEVTGETSWTKPAPQPQRVEPLVSDGTDVGAGNGVGNDVAARDMPGSLAPRAGAADSPDQFGSPSAPSGSSPGSGPLGPFMPKLLILLAASFVVMLQAAIEDGKEECTEVKDVSGGNCTPHNKSLVSYAVAVGTVSLLVLLGVLACARLRPELVGEKKFAMPRGKEAKPIHLLSGFLLLWWALGCGILTFHEPFKNTSNAYFACWVALLVSMLLGVDSYAAMHVAWKQYEDAAADLTTYFLLIMLLASFVLFLASLDYVSDSSQGAWGFSCALITALLTALYMAGRSRNKLTVPVSKVLTGLIFVLWVFGAGVLTFDEPFSNTGNGFFSCWVGVVASASLAYQCYFNTQIAWAQHLRNSFSSRRHMVSDIEPSSV
mmetsp:Transcript_20618/g.65934  ORF Transcript_20618/g.65934 Transcript_20618/m.65934 type:complete len:400 (+) Transcript_20618:115-1314(+)